MGDKLKVVECLDMKHGWTTRGDISDPNTKRYESETEIGQYNTHNGVNNFSSQKLYKFLLLV